VTLPIEDRLDGGDPPRPVTPTPTPTPYVVPAAPRTVPGWLWPLVAACAVAITGAVLWGVLMRPAPAPGPGPAPPTVDGRKLGRAFVAPLAESLADGFDAEAKALDDGKTVAEADAALKQAFHDARNAAFARQAGPAFAEVVPEKSEPKDDATRKAFAKLHRDFAAGLRGK
jgi:hypothetical protein